MYGLSNQSSQLWFAPLHPLDLCLSQTNICALGFGWPMFGSSVQYLLVIGRHYRILSSLRKLESPLLVEFEVVAKELTITMLRLTRTLQVLAA